MKTTKFMKQAAVAALILLGFSARAYAGSPPTSPHAMGVTTVSYSSESENFYFWLDGPNPDKSQTNCSNPEKFGVPVEPENEELIAQVKMAFLSGKQVKVSWYDDECAGGAPLPFYIKTYR